MVFAEAADAVEKALIGYPQEVLGTLKTREVLSYFIESGIEGTEALITEAHRARKHGARAFHLSRSDADVVRRVKSTLIIMGYPL